MNAQDAMRFEECCGGYASKELAKWIIQLAESGSNPQKELEARSGIAKLLRGPMSRAGGAELPEYLRILGSLCESSDRVRRNALLLATVCRTYLGIKMQDKMPVVAEESAPPKSITCSSRPPAVC